MKLVSVIVAVYNVEQYIEKCLISIKNQTYTDIEVILIDDGSKDTSGKICEEIAASDNRFRVIHKENEGLGFARNTGLEYVSGDYVVFIDGDDFLEPNMIETLVKYQSETHSDMIICGFKRYIDANQIKDISKIKEPVSFEGEKEIMEKILCPIIGNDASKNSNDGREMCVWTNLYSMDVIKRYNLRFVSEKVYLSEDFFFNIPYIKHSKKITMIPECLYNYRYNPASLSNSYRPNRFTLLENFMERARTMLDDEGISQYSSKRLQRLYFLKFRKTLLQISAANISKAEKKDKVTLAVSAKQCIDALEGYPIDDVKLNDAIMLKMIKAKKVSRLMAYMTLQRYMLNIRDLINKVRNNN
ncbi:MAG: glycosyltransferase family 2 protein [Pseudobutyrivibrio ruminis]|uniref:Glycosyltransferase family 2 protein n=1 Tax=Pseudobutyrivibrio ruminis TaxID=46206 RepID=A0A927YLP6_9FIRM|nr:glycosyltransferase family 2 protein [Pseudobutyrivibrio ruminis]